MTEYEIETKCNHPNAYMNEGTGVKRCPDCQCVRVREGIEIGKPLSGFWQWRRYNRYHIGTQAQNDARLAAIEQCFD